MVFGSPRLAGRRRGFTIVEVVIAAAILSLFFLGTCAILHFQRLAQRKVLEQSIMVDFAKHYLELARNQAFFAIAYGAPINPLYNGANGWPNITFPASASTWVSLNSTDYRTFNPDLQYVANKSPQFLCTLNTQVTAAGSRAIHLYLVAIWQPPLGFGGVTTTAAKLGDGITLPAGAWLVVQMETSIYQDFK